MKENPHFTLRQLITAFVIAALLLAVTAGALRGGEFGIAVIAALTHIVGVIILFALLALLALPFSLSRRLPAAQRPSESDSANTPQ